MLDFDPFAPPYPSYVHDNDPLSRLHAMQFDPLAAYNPYSPPPAAALAKFAPPSTPPFASSTHPTLQHHSFTFDPFADEDYLSTSSGASERERELEVQRLRRIEFVRRREWMRRVVAWVDGVSHVTTPTLSPSSTPTSSNSAPPPHRPYNYTPQRDSVDSPTLYYSSSPSVASRSDDDDEPYLIYSTPLPGTSQPSPPLVSPSPSPSPPVSKPVAPALAYTQAIPVPHISPPPQAPSSRRIHGRMRSLSSIREEDEGGA